MPIENLKLLIRRMIEAENSIVKSVTDSIDTINNLAVRSALKGVSYDSMKHAEMYAAANVLLTSVSRALTQEDLDKQKALVEKHIQIELKLIKKISKILPAVKNEKVKLLLNAILTDEKRHHELLKMVLEILVKGETITEEDWWDVLWKNVPFHGGPGG